MLDISSQVLPKDNINSQQKSIKLMFNFFGNISSQNLHVVVLSWCDKSPPLQIPEVRLNIISNLDCVNQGEVTVRAVQWIVLCQFYLGVNTVEENILQESAWVEYIQRSINCCTIASDSWQHAKKDMSSSPGLMDFVENPLVNINNWQVATTILQWVTHFFAPKALKQHAIE